MGSRLRQYLCCAAACDQGRGVGTRYCRKLMFIVDLFPNVHKFSLAHLILRYTSVERAVRVSTGMGDRLGRGVQRVWSAASKASSVRLLTIRGFRVVERGRGKRHLSVSWLGTGAPSGFVAAAWSRWTSIVDGCCWWFVVHAVGVATVLALGNLTCRSVFAQTQPSSGGGSRHVLSSKR